MGMISEGAVILAAAVLGGLGAYWGLAELMPEEWEKQRFWKNRLFYTSAAVYFLAMRVSGAPSLALLILTFCILSADDLKKQIIPDKILISYLIGQALLIVSEEGAGVMMYRALGGILFTAVLWLFALLSSGRVGMGDVKLLGVTALTAGWKYTIHLLILGMFLCFGVSVWLLVSRKADRKTELPFVPFLTASMLIRLFF